MTFAFFGKQLILVENVWNFYFWKTIDDHLLQIFINVEYDICIIWIESEFLSLKKWWRMRMIVAFFGNNYVNWKWMKLALILETLDDYLFKPW